MRAVRHHPQEKWVLLYIERWLRVPAPMPDGSEQQRERGTPQGGVISPLLANLFLHYTFRPRRSKHRYDKAFINFSPAISNKAAKAIRQEVRSWKPHLRRDKTLEDLGRMFDAIIRAWIGYYGAFDKSALYPTLRHLDRKLVWWATRKFKRLRGHRRCLTLVARGGASSDRIVCALAAAVWTGWIGRAG